MLVIFLFLVFQCRFLRTNEKEILEYCRSDVDILRQACNKFRDLLLKATGEEVDVEEDGEVVTRWMGGVDPFNCITIASVCMAVYKSKFLEGTYRVTLHNELDGSTIPWCLGKLRGGKWEVNIRGEWLDH